MQPSELLILKRFQYLTGYPLYYFHNQRMIFPQNKHDYHESPFVQNPSLYPILIEHLEDQTAGFIVDREIPEVYYGVLNMSKNDVVIVGPCTTLSISHGTVIQYMKAHNMHDFMNYQIGKVNELQMSSLLELIAEMLFHLELHTKPLKEKQDQIDDSILDRNLFTYRFIQSEEEKQHGSHAFEEEIFAYISDGNIEQLKELLFSHQSHEMGTFAKSVLKQDEYSAVIAVTYASRAAIDGGMNPYDSYDLSNVYLRQISEAKTQTEYAKIAETAIFGFTKEVQMRKNHTADSIHIEQAKEYIIRHINQPFTLQELAAYVEISPAYLSNLFSVQTKMTLKEYTLQERIRAAKNMLRFSDYSLSVIANYLCFHSQSYFGAQFKRITGMTPLQYRRAFVK